MPVHPLTPASWGHHYVQRPLQRLAMGISIATGFSRWISKKITHITRCMQGFATSIAVHAAELYVDFRNPRAEACLPARQARGY